MNMRNSWAMMIGCLFLLCQHSPAQDQSMKTQRCRHVVSAQWKMAIQPQVSQSSISNSNRDASLPGIGTRRMNAS